MIQIICSEISYVYNCLYPCGEDDVKIVVNNDVRTQDAQIGLSISQNSLTFIKDDANEVRTLIDTPYYYELNLNNLYSFHLDFANYEDDGIVVKVPLISSTVKDFLQNTTIENLGLSKISNKHFLKKPKTTVVFHFAGTTPEMTPYNESSLSGCTPEIISGVIKDGETNSISGEVFSLDYSLGFNAGIFFRKWIKIGTANVSAGYFSKKIKGQIILHGAGSATRTVKIHFVDYLDRYENGDKTDPIFVSSWLGALATFTMNEGTSQNFNLTNNTTPCIIERIATSPTTDYSLSFGVYVEVENSNPQTNVSVELIFDYEMSGSFDYIDYSLPVIPLKDIYDACYNTRGVNLPSVMNTNDIFITSPNIVKLWNIKLIDIVTFWARMKGEVLSFGFDSCGMQPYSYIFGFMINAGNNFCNYTKKGISQDYSYKIGKNPSKMRLANVPEGMWANSYSTTRKSNLLKQNTISGEIVYDGAEIMNILISNDQSVFIIDNTNNNIESDDDTPLNYNYSACMVVKNNLCRIISNSEIGVTTYTPDDTAGNSYTIPNSGGTTTSQSMVYSGLRLAPYTEEMDIPMTSTLIANIFSLGFLCGLQVNGVNYVVESCEFGITPSQVHFVGRRVISA